MAKTKLVVKTEVGTFTRTTNRTYSHIVVVAGYKAERLEANRLSDLKAEKKAAAEYRRAIETGEAQDVRRDPVAAAWDRECHAKFLAEGKYQEWIASAEARIAKLEARGVITEDGHTWSDENYEALTGKKAVIAHTILGWCGRLDLALKLAATDQASAYRSVRIFDVATGAEVK